MRRAADAVGAGGGGERGREREQRDEGHIARRLLTIAATGYFYTRGATRVKVLRPAQPSIVPGSSTPMLSSTVTGVK
jgi:hypothetical protein